MTLGKVGEVVKVERKDVPRRRRRIDGKDETCKKSTGDINDCSSGISEADMGKKFVPTPIILCRSIGMGEAEG